MERSINEIFYDGIFKLKVQRADNTISCKGCFYNTLVNRDFVGCKLGENNKRVCDRPRDACRFCKYGLYEIRKVWECRRNLLAAGLCQATFRDDGESVVFVEIENV